LLQNFKKMTEWRAPAVGCPATWRNFQHLRYEFARLD
jgi:hypothetical protein